MKFNPKFDSHLVARTRQGEASAMNRSTPAEPDERPGFRVPATGWFAAPEAPIEHTEPASERTGDDPLALPEPAPWLADLLQQRKEMKS